MTHRCHLLSIAAKGYPPGFLLVKAEAPSSTLVWAGGSARAGPAVAAAVPLPAACMAEGGLEPPDAPLLGFVLPPALLLAARKAMHEWNLLPSLAVLLRRSCIGATCWKRSAVHREHGGAGSRHGAGVLPP